MVKSLNMQIFEGKKWIFQQDSAPGYKAWTIHAWLQCNVPHKKTAQEIQFPGHFFFKFYDDEKVLHMFNRDWNCASEILRIMAGVSSV